MLATELYRRVRERLDIEPGSYLDDTEIGQVCAEQYVELWDVLLTTMGDEAPWERIQVPTVPGTDQLTIDVASGVHRIVRLDILGPSNTWDPMLRFALASESLSATPQPWTSAQSARYAARRSFRAGNATLAGSPTAAFAAWVLVFSPPPSGVYQVRVWYVPPPRIIMVASGGPYAVTYSEFPDEFPDYVIEGAAAWFAAKQELDPAPFLDSKARIARMIESYYKPHQITQPRTVADLRKHQNSPFDSGSSYDFQRRR